MAPQKRLAIIDWGIGGIGIYREIKRRADIPIIYFSDTGATPYGKMDRSELVSRLDSVINFLSSKGVTDVLIGCNAASTAIPFLAASAVEIESVIDTAVREAVKKKPQQLGLIGGRRTVLSGVYRRAFAEHGIVVKQRVAQPLSGMIERGNTSSKELHDECRRILSPLRHCSQILLACTHYPAIAGVMGQFVSPKTRFIDPAPAVAARVLKRKLSTGGTDEFFTTGDAEAMRKAAWNAFSVAISKASVVAAL